MLWLKINSLHVKTSDVNCFQMDVSLLLFLSYDLTLLPNSSSSRVLGLDESYDLAAQQRMEVSTALATSIVINYRVLISDLPSPEKVKRSIINLLPDGEEKMETDTHRK